MASASGKSWVWKASRQSQRGHRACGSVTSMSSSAKSPLARSAASSCRQPALFARFAAGTAMPSQLPFFVAACDYTLIGEEFFAASAYLSGQPDQLGSLKGQDVGKLIVAAVLIIGCLLATVAVVTDNESLAGAIAWFKDSVLSA